MLITARKNSQKRRGRPSRLDDPKYVSTLTALYPNHQTTEIATILDVPVRTIQAHVKALGLDVQENDARGLDTTGREINREADQDSVAP